MAERKPPTDAELLRLAGKMYLAAEQVLISDARNLSARLDSLEVRMGDYNDAVIWATEARKVKRG